MTPSAHHQPLLLAPAGMESILPAMRLTSFLGHCIDAAALPANGSQIMLRTNN